AKVDTSAPSVPSLSFGSFTNASATGSTVYVRAGHAGAFTVTASSSDAETGVSSYSLPSLGSGWSSSAGSSSNAYSFDSSASAPAGAQSVSASNAAGSTSSAGTFTVVSDTTAPVTSVSCNGAACSSGWYTSAVSVGLTASDAASGVSALKYT